MNIYNSIFKKNFISMAAILAIAVTLLTGTFTIAVSSYSTAEKRSQLQKAMALTESILQSYHDGYSGQKALRENLLAIATIYDISITAVDEQGEVFIDFAAEGQERTDYGMKSTLDSVLLYGISRAQDSYLVGTMNGFFPQKTAVFVRSLTLDPGGSPIYLFTGASMASLNDMFRELSSLLVLSSLVILCVAFLISFATTSHTVRPILELRDAARSFGQGDFSRRVRVRGKDEVAELSDAFNKMAETLAINERTRSEFLANVSHELKTPMTSITGFADGMLDGTIPVERRDEYLRTISEEAKRLSRLVNKLLLTSRIDAGRQEINIARVNICDLIGRCALSLEQRIEEKNLEVDIRFCEEQVFVQADPDAITQVVYNLIDNAQKYADPGGLLRISVERRGERALVSVYNTGKGIPTEDLPHIFERFYKVDKSRSLSKDSFGLGLYIVKMLVNRHGEDIVARSNPGEYAEFSFTLKLDKQKSNQSAPELPAPAVTSMYPKEEDNHG